jgi:hypothetical protein
MGIKNTSRIEHTNLRPERASATDGPSGSDMRQARLKRVDEYETEGLARPESFECLIALVQADLFRSACVSEDAAKEALVGLSEAKSISDWERAIHRHLAIARRIARNSGLEVRTRSARK